MTDKFASNYHPVYDKFLEPIRNNKINLLEIGLGTITHGPSNMFGWKEQNVDYLPGASLKAFRDYFPNGLIYGVDIQPDCMFTDERIETFLFNSTDNDLCNANLKDMEFDVIIDDGDHSANFQIKTFENLYHRLKLGGYYFIEDVAFLEPVTEYFEKTNYNYEFYNRLLVIKKPKNDKFKILNNTFAEKGFFINLSDSKDRLNKVKSLIDKYQIENLERFEALTDEFIQSSCTKSHLEVFKKALNENLEVIFVAEDDFDISDTCYNPLGEPINIEDALNDIHKDLQNQEWDVILLGCNPKTPMIPISKNLALIHKSTGAWGYLIKKKAYQYLIENSNYYRDLIAIDDYLPMLNEKGFITLAAFPMVIGHSIGFESTLQPRGPVDYTSFIYGNYHKFLYDNFKDFKENIVEQNLTIIIAGHFVKDYIYYLKYLIYSLPKELLKCRFLVHYDLNHAVDETPQIHQLISFFKDIESDLNVSLSWGTGGLISTIDNTIEKIKTKYYLFLEHDWVFLKNDNIDFKNLLKAFNNHDYINAVWFSKDDNTMRSFEITQDIDGITTPFELETRVNEVNLITTCRWSNNPVVFRTSKMKEWYYEFIKNEHVGTLHQGCHNVEETMIPTYREEISENKWNDVKDKWGTYLYGNLGEGPYVGHLDASKRYQGSCKSQPEINGEEYVKNNSL